MRAEDAKVGMVVVGNEKANNYTYSTNGYEGVIIKIPNNHSFIIRGLKDGCEYLVEDFCFDMVTSLSFSVTERQLRDLIHCPEGYDVYIEDDAHSPYRITSCNVLDKYYNDYSYLYFLYYYMEDKMYHVEIHEDEVEEMTLEEVCKALGKNIKIVKEKNND